MSYEADSNNRVDSAQQMAEAAEEQKSVQIVKDVLEKMKVRRAKEYARKDR